MSDMKGFGTDNDATLVDILIDNREYIYPALFYSCGLVIGTFFFGQVDASFIKKIIDTLAMVGTNYMQLFVNRFCVYFSLFVLTVLLGMCLIGFPFVNIMPLMVGMETGIKLAYYYVSFGAKGIGYSILMIIPEITALITVLVFTIRSSTELSKSIYDATTRKSDMITDVDLKSYLKSFLLYGCIVVVISAINALLEFLLRAIIKI